jgi:hypothetical protein
MSRFAAKTAAIVQVKGRRHERRARSPRPRLARDQRRRSTLIAAKSAKTLLEAVDTVAAFAQVQELVDRRLLRLGRRRA